MQTLEPATFFTNSYYLFLIKIGILIILVIYAIFALVIIRQVSLMNSTLITGTSRLLKILAIFHAALAIGLTILIWVLL